MPPITDSSASTLCGGVGRWLGSLATNGMTRYTRLMTKLSLMAAIPILILAQSAYSTEAKFGELTVQQVNERRGKPNFFVYDNNREERFKKSHLPGAKWVNPMALTEKDLPGDKNATLVFYCSNEH